MAVNEAIVATLIPAYNEETQIGAVLRSLPAYVDHIVVVDDGSTDRTVDVVSRAAAADRRIHLIELGRNQGVGAAMAAAYEWARDRSVDVAVSLDADGQMDVDEMINLVMPIVDGRADLTKGNRLVSPAHWQHIPRIRLFGNAALSLLTKIASGYWTVADSQSGYTAVSRYALENIDWKRLYKGYGRPNDLLVRANLANCRVADVPIRPVYGVGERSTMKIFKVVFTISLMLFRRFWWRLFHKYVLREFHPLVFFYLLAVTTFLADIALTVRMCVMWGLHGRIPPTNALAVTFLTITALNSAFFAFWMDMQVNDALAVRLPEFFMVRSEVSHSEARLTRTPEPGAAPTSISMESSREPRSEPRARRGN